MFGIGRLAILTWLVLLCCAGAPLPAQDPPPDDAARDGVASGAAPPHSERAAQVEAVSPRPVVVGPGQSPRSRPRDAWHWLEERGLSPRVTLISDWSKNFRGGACSTGSVYRQLLKPSLTIDMEEALGWKGAKGFASLASYAGGNGGDYAGDIQGFSNIDATPRTRLYEAWFEQTVRKLRIKAGQVDANTEFATVERAADFLNSSMGYSPTILRFPAYPDPRPSLNVFFQPNERYNFGVGFYATINRGTLMLVEGGRRWQLSSAELAGRAGLGFWRASGTLPSFSGPPRAATHGMYLVLEQDLWRHAGRGREQTLSVSFQFGNASPETSIFTVHTGAGVLWRGPIRRRAHDALGFAVTHVGLTRAPGAGLAEPEETVFELVYRMRFGRFVSLAPDFQYVQHPAGAPADALVFTPRLVVNF